MRIEHPGIRQLPALRQLWKTAFGDEDAFLDAFFTLAWEADHSLCALEGEDLAGMLYWLDCSCGGEKLGYVYAVATDPAFRGRGVCRRLLAQAQEEMTAHGCAGAVLVPGSAELRKMYEKLGWQTVTEVEELNCKAEETGLRLHRIGAETYARLRRQSLPEGGVVQEGRSLALLASQETFFAGEQTLLAGHWDRGELKVTEFLGDPLTAPGITAALGADRGSFRLPGRGTPFAMMRKFRESCPEIRYFGLAFD